MINACGNTFRFANYPCSKLHWYAAPLHVECSDQAAPAYWKTAGTALKECHNQKPPGGRGSSPGQQPDKFPATRVSTSTEAKTNSSAKISGNATRYASTRSCHVADPPVVRGSFRGPWVPHFGYVRSPPTPLHPSHALRETRETRSQCPWSSGGSPLSSLQKSQWNAAKCIFTLGTPRVWKGSAATYYLIYFHMISFFRQLNWTQAESLRIWPIKVGVQTLHRHRGYRQPGRVLS